MDEDRIIAWLDGELDPAEAEAVARAVAADPALTARAEAHRQLKARLSAAFGSIMKAPPPQSQSPMPRPEAEVVSLAAARAARTARTKRASPRRWNPQRWALPGAVAASLCLGLAAGSQLQVAGIADRDQALALAAPLGHALDAQLSGQPGPIRVALSFRDKGGAYCRSFSAAHLGGVACRDDGGWQLRYAAPAGDAQGDYRQAGADAAQAELVQSIIAGDPLDARQEQAARVAGWR